MDASFIDLDILLTRIRNVQSRTYFLDAVRAYKAGALRAALTGAWVALAYDLIAKYRELSAMGDPAATAFIQSWDAATVSNDIARLMKLEASIIDDATVNTQAISQIARTHLERLREDRHLCAHPAFSADAQLFEPTAELVRLHLVNAVDLVLAQEPLQGRAIFDLFDVDVQSTGFPIAHDRIVDYVEQRYLTRVRPQNVRNFGLVLAKSLLKGLPPQWEGIRGKIVSSLVAVRERAPAMWPDIAASTARLIDNLEPDNRPRAIAFIAAFPDYWALLQEPTQTALRETVENTTPENLADYRILAGLTFETFRPGLLRVVAHLERDGLARAVAAWPSPDLWPIALRAYELSPGWRSSEANFQDLVAPFAPTSTSEHMDNLLAAVSASGENWNAGGTPAHLYSFFRNSGGRLPSTEARTRFFEFLRGMQRLANYEDVITIFRGDGWVPPAAIPPRDD